MYTEDKLLQQPLPGLLEQFDMPEGRKAAPMNSKQGTGTGDRVMPRDYVERYWPEAFPNLQHEVKQAEATSLSIRVSCRGQYDWLAIARRTDDAGGPIVCFGNGETYHGALAALNKSVAAGAWRPDKFAAK